MYFLCSSCYILTIALLFPLYLKNNIKKNNSIIKITFPHTIVFFGIKMFGRVLGLICHNLKKLKSQKVTILFNSHDLI